MNLTQTKRWSEFVEWYIATFKQNAYSQIVALYDGQSFDSFITTSNYESDWYINFAQLPFEFQEGVYRKFMKSLDYCAIEFAKYWSLFEGDTKIPENFKSEQEAIQYFFNNE
jgi:hypothetical protein